MTLPQLVDDPFRAGDAVQATFRGQTVDAVVSLASHNGRSFVIHFEAILGGFVGQMAIFQDDDGGYCELFTGDPVLVHRRVTTRIQ